MMPLLMVSCSDVLENDMIEPSDKGQIMLHFRTPGVEVKGTIEDNDCESFMSHIDVMIYSYDGVINGEESYTPFHYERISVSATPWGKTSIGKTKDDFKDGVEYKIYVIANSTHSKDVYYNNGTLIEYDDFLDLDQTDRLIHLSGVDFEIQNPHYPQMFLMDGVAYMGENEPSSPGRIVINDGSAEDDVTIKVTLRRAAAKIIMTIKPGDKVEFTPQLMAQSRGYMIRNMPERSTLAAEGGYPRTNGGANPYWNSTTISQTPYLELIPVVENGVIVNYNIQMTAYCYSHTWRRDEVFERGTAIVMMLPMIYTEDGKEPVEFVNNYYQFSFSKKEGDGSDTYHLIKRNTLYDLRINLNAPGAEDFNEPEEIQDIQYFTAPWQDVDMNISGEQTVKYLKVNKEKMYMYNVADDNTSLYFSSSSPVTVSLVSGSAYYYNKYNNKITLSDSDVTMYADTEDGSISGNIAVHSDIPTNYTIRYFRLKVENEEGMVEYVDVEQYPLVYIRNNLPWYSYRDDYYYRTGEGHSWDGYISNDPVAGDAPTTYRYSGDHIVSVEQITNVNTETKQVTYKYTHTTPSHNSITGFTASKVRGNKSGNNYDIRYYYFDAELNRYWDWDKWGYVYTYDWEMKTSSCETHNVRNYHVRMMASSGDYTLARPRLDEYGYTAGDSDNAKLVSPSFVIASRLGAVLSTYSGLSGMSNDKKLIAFADHCKNYVEVDDLNDDARDPVEVHDNWRLPTEAELKIIIDIQGESGEDAAAIDYLLNGAYYMSASGPVYNPKNAEGSAALDNPMNATDVAIRCVRDAY